MQRNEIRTRARRALTTGAALGALVVLGGAPAVVGAHPAVGTSPEAVLVGTEEAPADLDPVMPIPATAKARFFHLDPEAFEKAAVEERSGDDSWRDPTSACRSLTPSSLKIELLDGRQVSVTGTEAEHCELRARSVKGIDDDQVAPSSEYTAWIGQAKTGDSILVSAQFSVITAADGTEVVIGSIDDASGSYVVQPADADGLSVLYRSVDPELDEAGYDQINPPSKEEQGGELADLRPDAGAMTPEAEAPAPAEMSPWSSTVPSSAPTTVPTAPSTTTSVVSPPKGVRRAVGRASLPPANADAVRTVTLAVVYANGVSANDALWHAASGAVKTNAVLANSNLPVHVEVVGTPVHSNYTQVANLQTNLDAFRAAGDGHLEEVHTLQPALDADLATLVMPGDEPGACAGIGYVPFTFEAAHDRAYTAANLYGCDNGVLPHELGHNLGAHHNPEDSVDPVGVPPYPDFPFTYAYGHYVNGKARDTMAYETAAHCPSGCPGKPQYADPDIDMIGFPGVPSGTTTRRAADSIRATSWGVSALYPETSNDNLWFNAANRSHTSQNVESTSGNDPESPFTAIGGDFNGSFFTVPAQGDIFWYHPDKAPDSVWYFNGSGGAHSVGGETLLGTYRPVSGDLDGDGRDDLFWHGPGSTPDLIWWGDAWIPNFGEPGYTSSRSVSGSYTPTAGDFDGDGYDDILWYSPTGADSIWWGGAARTAFGTVASSVSIPAGYDPISGDFDGDGRDDLLLYGEGTTADSIWWGQPTASRADFGTAGFTSARSINGSYRPAAGDFDHDGSDDVMLYGPGSSADLVWWGDDRTTFGPGSQTSTTVNGQYASPIVGDFDANGTDDLYWFAFG